MVWIHPQCMSVGTVIMTSTRYTEVAQAPIWRVFNLHAHVPFSTLIRFSLMQERPKLPYKAHVYEFVSKYSCN